MTNGMLIVERIDRILKERKLNRVAIAEAIGINPQNISAWSSRGTVPAGDVCLKIADYLNVSVEWLICGRESRIGNEERWLLSQWQAMDEAQKDTIRTLMEKWESDREVKEKQA